MQLIQSPTKKTRKLGKISAALAAASGSLLSTTATHAEETPWLVDSAVLVYSESGGRVKATEPIVSMKKDFGDEHVLNLKFTYDSLTGASPNGAIPTKETVTFTGPSGNGSTSTTVVGELPKNSFEDQRSAFNLSWEQPFGDNNHVSFGGNYSSENDYVSRGFNAALARDFFNKNTTLSIGVNLESDSSEPIGGVPNALTANSLSNTGRATSETKTVHDLLLGITQVMSRYWLTQLNYSYSNSSGYQNDPYKILSVVDITGSSVKAPNDFTQNLYLYENRPDSRIRQSLFWGNKIHLTEDVINFSLRHYSDDWGITSNTLDLRYRMALGTQFYIEPHLRYYTQSHADFYEAFLIAGKNVFGGTTPYKYASSDPRLAKFDADTFGIKLGYIIGRNSELTIRFEQYTQKTKESSAEVNAMPGLNGLDLHPDLKAKTVMLGYSFEF